MARLTKQANELKMENQTYRRITRPNDLEHIVKTLRGNVEIGVTRIKAKFNYELNEVDAFLESGNVHLSEHFACNLTWYLKFETKVEGEEKFLSIFLFSKNYVAGKVNWSIKSSLAMLLLGQSGGPNKLFDANSEFITKTFIEYSWPSCISIKNLRAGGYIKDNKIKITIWLEGDELVSGE